MRWLQSAEVEALAVGSIIDQRAQMNKFGPEKVEHCVELGEEVHLNTMLDDSIFDGGWSASRLAFRIEGVGYEQQRYDEDTSRSDRE